MNVPFRLPVGSRFKALVLCGIGLLGSRGLAAQAVKPTILWPSPAAIPYQTPLSGIQLDATVLSAPPVQVSLVGVANVEGITTPGTTAYDGFDHDSLSYAEELIGSSIQWQGISFALGQANRFDAVSTLASSPSGTIVPLPAGGFGRLLMLGDMVDNISPSVETFTVAYADGSTTSVQQGMSDWVNPRNYPGETVVQCYPWRHNFDGTNDQNSVCAYGYSIALDPTKTVASLTLPNSREIVMLSFVLVPPIVDGTTTYEPASGTVLGSGQQTLNASFASADSAAYTDTTAQVSLTVTPLAGPIVPTVAWAGPAPIVLGTPLSGVQLDAQAGVPAAPMAIPIVPESRVNAIYEDGSHFNEKGFDGNSVAYSANQLGSSLAYAGFQFALGPLAVPDAATSATIPVPPGSYSTLYLIGAGANGPQADQPFTIHYVDGSTSVANVSLSSWTDPKNFAGETLVSQTSYADTAKGGTLGGTYDVYGYQAAVDPTKVATGVSLPMNPDVVLLALGIGAGGDAPVDGTYVYNPPSGTVFQAIGTYPLDVSFTPMDTTDLGPALGHTTIEVVNPTLTVTANDATKVYGTANPLFTGNIAGAKPGDAFTESFSTAAVASSNAGSYAIVPSAQGTNLASYQVTIVPGTLTVAKAPVRMTLAASATTEIQGQPLALTAGVQSTTTGTPTGSVQFFSKGVSLGSATLVNGSAALSTQALAVGTDALTATYGGDIDFLPSAASAGAPVLVTSADFTFTAPAGLTITDVWGHTATLLLHVSSLSTVYSSTVSFSMDTPLPPLASTSFSPVAIAPNAGPQDVTFTYDSRLLSRMGDAPANRSLPWLPLACGLLAFPLAGLARLRRLRGMRLVAMLLFAIASASMLGGCGSGYKSGEFPLVVTATDGVHSHSLTLTLDLLAP